jgi:ubiquitin-protein ligase
MRRAPKLPAGTDGASLTLSPRGRRLLSDLRQMQQLDDETIAFRAEGDPPEHYELMFSVPGLELLGTQLRVRRMHRCEVYLHLDYPRRPPVVTWQTPVFHPNLLGPDRNGGVCLGSWSAGESLLDLSLRLRDLVSYRVANAADPLNRQAAEWMRDNQIEPGADLGKLRTLTLDDDVPLAVRS